VVAADRIAYVVEHLDIDQRGPMATGLFDCEVRLLVGDEWLGEYSETPLPLTEALVWARSRANRVSVRIDDQFFSAGRVPVSHPPIDESLALEARRPVGWEFLDAGPAGPLTSWDVVVQIEEDRDSSESVNAPLRLYLERWCAALAEACEVTEVAGPPSMPRTRPGAWVRSATTPLAVLRFDAQGYESAVRTAIALASNAADAASWDHPPRFSVGGVFPTGSSAARRDAHVPS
jgi:hypothetical protein